MGRDGSRGVAAAPWRVATAQVFVEDLEDPRPSDADHHHLMRVLRLRAGEVVCAADGAGGWRPCRIRVEGGLEPDGEIVRVPAPERVLGVGFAPVKGERPEWVVQKLTEVGIDRIVVVRTSRSVVRWEGERGERHLARLRTSAREAATQCRRLWLPEIASSTLSELRHDRTTVLADAGGRPLTDGDRLVLVGPEGGWTDEEREGADTVALAADVLRAETAAVIAGAALTSLRVGLTRPGLPSSHPE